MLFGKVFFPECRGQKIDSFTRFWLLLGGLNPFWGSISSRLNSFWEDIWNITGHNGDVPEHSGNIPGSIRGILGKIRGHFGKDEELFWEGNLRRMMVLKKV